VARNGAARAPSISFEGPWAQGPSSLSPFFPVRHTEEIGNSAGTLGCLRYAFFSTATRITDTCRQEDARSADHEKRERERERERERRRKRREK